MFVEKGLLKLLLIFFGGSRSEKKKKKFDEKEENERKRHALREEEEERDRHVWATRSSSERVDEHHREWPERVSLVRVQRQQSEKEGEQNDRSSNPSGKTSGTT